MFKFKKSSIFLIIASLILALMWGGKLPYFILYVIIITIAVSYFWSGRIAKRLDFNQKVIKDYVYVGDEIEINTIIYNESFLPAPCIEIKNGLIRDLSGKSPNSNIISIMPFSSRIVAQKVKCKYRGVYNFGPIDIIISDVFGLFTWSRQIICHGTLTVFPKVVSLRRFTIRPMQTFGTVTTKQKANEDYSSISDIRKYYPGDSFKKIHWKLSAHKGSLYVKNFEMSGSCEAYIFLNLFHNDYYDMYRADMEEKAVECACAIIYYMLSKNINTGLYANSKEPVYIRGRDVREFNKFMQELIRVKSDGISPLEELLEQRSRILPRGSSIILITPELNKEIIDKIIQLKEDKFDVIIVYIMIEDLNQEIVRVINHYGIKLFKIGINDEIRTALGG